MNACAEKSIDLVAFDWDNTIADSHKLLEEAHKLTARDFHIDSHDAHTKDPHFWALPSTKILQTLYGEDNLDLAREYFERNYMYLIENRLELMPYAKECIVTLYEKGINLAIISNKGYYFLEHEIELFQLGQYFKAVVGSRGDKNEDKPNVNAFIIAERRLNMPGINKNNVWYVGDSQIDIEFSKNVAMNCLLVNPKIDELTFDIDNKFKFKTLEQVTKFLCP